MGHVLQLTPMCIPNRSQRCFCRLGTERMVSKWFSMEVEGWSVDGFISVIKHKIYYFNQFMENLQLIALSRVFIPYNFHQCGDFVFFVAALTEKSDVDFCRLLLCYCSIIYMTAVLCRALYKAHFRFNFSFFYSFFLVLLFFEHKIYLKLSSSFSSMKLLLSQIYYQ